MIDEDLYGVERNVLGTELRSEVETRLVPGLTAARRFCWRRTRMT